MLSFDLILVFIVLLFILISLYREILGPAFTFMVGVITLGIFGVLTPAEILKGFANEQVAVVILLLVIGNLLRKTGAVEIIFDRYFKSAKSYRGFLSRMILLLSGFSSFLNNTPLVAVMMPYVHNWCKRNNFTPSKFMIPLSYAAILGGCATLIGTSTNLIVGGLVAEQTIAPDLKPLNIFDFSAVGFTMVFIGYLYMMFIGNRLLPSRPDVITQFSTGGREYLLEARIPEKSELVGKTVEESGFNSFPGIDLVEIWRRGYKITDFGPELLMDRGDILIFAGDNETIADMIKEQRGLSLPEVGVFAKKKRSEIVEVVVSQNSTLINKTVRGSDFRNKYDAAVISIHRNGELIKGRVGEVEQKAGDVLLLFTGADFVQRTAATTDFYFISKVREFVRVEWYKNAVLLGGIIAAITLSAFRIFPLILSLLITSVLAAYITAKAAAAIIFPISLTTAVNLGLNPLPFVLIVAFASAANFMTPVGFQTNLMVYGPGGYTFTAFFKVGAPLTFLYMIVSVAMLYLIYLV